MPPLANRRQTNRSAAIRARGKWSLTLAAALAALLASPASAATEPRTRLVACEAGNCLLVTGDRTNEASAVHINGHAVSVEGTRKWRVRLPVDTVREWSTPLARTITVSVADAMAPTEAEADLPIGLLGHAENLAMLFVSIK